MSLGCEACDQEKRPGSISVPTSVAAIGIRAAGASMFGFRSGFAIGRGERENLDLEICGVLNIDV